MAGRDKVKKEAKAKPAKRQPHSAARGKLQKEKEQTRQAARKAVQEAGSEYKRPKFLRARMWVNYLLSTMQKDRGRIPDNIGDKILISNNMYTTRYYMSSIVQITSLSSETPVTFAGEIIQYLRKNDCEAVVDVTFKNNEYPLNLKDVGLQGRVEMWEHLLDSEDATASEKMMAAACMYTYDIAREGNELKQTRIFITIREKTGSALTNAEKLVFKYLNSIGATYLLLTGDIKEKLQYMSLISDYHSVSLKDIKAVITSEQTLSQMLPNSNSINDLDGPYLGNNVTNGTQFMLDLNNITGARNFYVLAQSGVGKTVLVQNMCCSCCEDGMAVCVQDIKGNEFTNFINATGGYIVSLRQNSSGYINSWKMNKEDTTDQGAEMYFKNRLNFSKEQMMILSGITNHEERIELEELLDSFLESVYISKGVLPINRNTWDNTKDLDPYVIYELFVQYMTPEMQRKYHKIANSIINSWRMTMTLTGSKSYIFKKEFDYLSILKAPTLMFDFGILEETTELEDPMIFKLKFAYMRKLNADYVAYKYRKGIKTLKILEESQIAVNDPDIMKGYVEEYTLRRAQGQTTVLLGNSISALTDNPLSKSIVENTKAILLGELGPTARENVIKTYGLEKYQDMIERIGTSGAYKNSFLFVNEMQERAIAPILKIELSDGEKYKLFTPVPQNDNYLV